MTPKLTNEMREALEHSHGRPVDVEDPKGTTYVLIQKEAYLHLENLRGDADETARSQLRSLMQEGIDSGPGIAAEEAFARLRARAQQLAASSS